MAAFAIVGLDLGTLVAFARAVLSFPHEILVELFQQRPAPGGPRGARSGARQARAGAPGEGSG